MNILETKDLFHDFSGLKVLFGVNLQVEEGERHAVIGPNGAGKTTLFNVINGAYKPRRGQVFFKGKEITGAKPHELTRLGMGRSFQLTSTFNRMTAFQNIRLAVLSKQGVRFHLFRKVDKMQDITNETDEVLKRINLHGERNIPAGMLSYGKHRALEISLALATDPDLILLDEPTAGMSRDETHHAVKLIRKLTEGKTVVIIEHDMDVVFSLADRITVLNYGTVIATGPPEEIRKNQAVKDAYLGESEALMLLDIKELHTFYGASHALQGISLSVEEGQIASLLGRNGMGKSTTLKSVMGLMKPRSGAILFKGKQVSGLPPYKVAMAGIGYVPEERRIFPTLSVTDNLLLGVKGGKIDASNPHTWTLERIFKHFPALRLRANSRGAHLSGGEQQMLSIGRSLMGNPSLLLVDEPTEGLAPLMAAEVRDVLAEINKTGVSILLVEHNLKIAMSLAHKVYLMGKAHIGFQGTVEELNANPGIRAKYLEV